jgi:hypothetical protein
VALALPGGRDVYVAPKAFAADRGSQTLLAGVPNYIFGPRAAGAARTIDSANAILGVTIGTDGMVRTIHSPIEPLRLLGLSALAREDGDWDLVFAELASSRPIESRTMGDSVNRLWYGVYRDSAWSSLEQLPIPPDLRISAAETSYAHLARNGDSLVWAVGVTSRGRQAALVFERVEGHWALQLIPTGSWVDLAVNYAGDSTLALGFVRGDTSLPSDQNSLFLWTRGQHWQSPQRRVLGSRDGFVYTPSLSQWRGRAVLTWSSAQAEGEQVRAMLDALASPAGLQIVVDSTAQELGGFATLPLANGNLLWVTTHRGSGAGKSTLHFRVQQPGGQAYTAQLPNPFLTRFRALAGPGALIYLTGPVEADNAGGAVSAILTVRVSCRGRAP